MVFGTGISLNVLDQNLMRLKELNRAVSIISAIYLGVSQGLCLMS